MYRNLFHFVRYAMSSCREILKLQAYGFTSNQWEAPMTKMIIWPIVSQRLGNGVRRDVS